MSTWVPWPDFRGYTVQHSWLWSTQEGCVWIYSLSKPSGTNQTARHTAALSPLSTCKGQREKHRRRGQIGDSPSDITGSCNQRQAAAEEEKEGLQGGLCREICGASSHRKRGRRRALWVVKSGHERRRWEQHHRDKQPAEAICIQIQGGRQW